MSADRETGILELIAVCAIIYVMWRMTRKTKVIPVSEEPIPDECKNIVYKPLSPVNITPANLLGKGWCYKGDMSVLDYSQGTGVPYMEEQAQEYAEMKQEEAIRATNRSCIQFRLINSSAVPITSKGFNTTEDSNIFDGTDDIVTPDAPVASSATGVTSSGFTANWSAVSGATGYYLDVATDSSFTSYVSGYQNKDVNNVTSYSVTGLSDKTTYYFRVRAYHPSGTTSISSNVIDTETDYATVTIGSQIWMEKNISVNISGSKVYDDNEDNRDLYGGLYDISMISAVEALYPGYHVPTKDEWDELATYLGGYTYAGGKMKETGTTYWNSPNTDATNQSGFSGKGGGYYNSTLLYVDLKERGYYWTSTQYSPSRYYFRYMRYDSGNLEEDNSPTTDMFSIRLIKD